MANNPWLVTIFLLGWLIGLLLMFLLSLVETKVTWKAVLVRTLTSAFGYLAVVDAILTLIPLFFLGLIWVMSAGTVWIFPNYVHFIFSQGMAWMWWSVGIASIIGSLFGELAVLDEDYQATGIKTAWYLGFAVAGLWWLIVLIGLIVNSVVSYG